MNQHRIPTPKHRAPQSYEQAYADYLDLDQPARRRADLTQISWPEGGGWFV
jgi:hypothetical protein